MTRVPLPEPLQSFDSPPPAMLTRLSRVESRILDWQNARRSGRVLPNTLESLRIEQTYHSNAIEGSTLTLRETQLVIEGLSLPAGKSLREVYEARNHDRAIRLVEQWAESRAASQLVSERDLLDLHATVLAEIEPANAGRYRTERVRISGTRFIPPGGHRFPELIPAALALANTADRHPVLRAAELHYNLVAAHPFTDGNGRTARLMMNYALLRAGCPHVIIDVASRADYLATLDEANAGRWEPFADFIIRSAEQSIRRALGEG